MKLAILAGLLMAFGLAGILVCTLTRVHQSYIDERIDYGILLDAGSSATRAYIYQWRHKTTKDLPFVFASMSKHNEPFTKEIHPGLASLVPNYTSVGDYLEPLIAWAHKKIPEDAVSSTPIFLQGTGGLRQLSDFESSALLTSVRYKLQDTGFYFENSYARVLSGKEEAAYGFIAVNALYDRFEPADNPVETYGSLDLGGVSTNIAFVSATATPQNYSYSTTLNGTAYLVYAQSIDGLGINQARYKFNASLFDSASSRLVVDPCVPFGYFENVTVMVRGVLQSFTLMGNSDPVQCQSQVSGLVRGLTSSYPKPPTAGTFVVADNYVKVKNFFKLKDNTNLLELSSKVSSFCLLPLVDAIAHHEGYADVQNYCFMGTYVVTLLEDFYQFNPTKHHIFWKDSVHKAPVTWTLGSMLSHASGIPPDTSDPHATRHVRFYHTDAGVVTLFISVLLVLLGAVLFILQQRRSADYVLIQ